MRCAFCDDELNGKPIKQNNEFFCSIECADLASGIDPEESEGYFEEEPIEELNLPEDE